jgi:hypothetical protein
MRVAGSFFVEHVTWAGTEFRSVRAGSEAGWEDQLLGLP